jgi:hypothetical protein
MTADMSKNDFTPFDIATDEAMSAVDGVVLNSVLTQAMTTVSQNNPDTFEHTRLEERYHLIDEIVGRSMIAYKAANTLPLQALLTFRGWTKTSKVDDEFQAISYEWFLDHIFSGILAAASKGRIYGDGFLILCFDDGGSMEEPLIIENIFNFHGVIAKSRQYVIPAEGVSDIAKAEFFHVSSNTVEDAAILNSMSKENVGHGFNKVHRSRILHFPGLIDHSDAKDSNLSGHNKSVFSYCAKEIDDYRKAKEQVLKMLTTHSTYVISIDGLVQGVRSKNVADLANRFVSFLSTINIFGGVVVDAKREKAEIINRSYSGLDNILKQIEESLANTSDLPPSYILASNGSNFSEQAVGDRYVMSQLIDTYYLTHLRKPLNYINFLYCALVGRLDDFKTEKYKISKVSSLILTRNEESEVRFKNAQADVLYTIPTDPEDPLSAVLFPEDVRTRWESSEYSDDLTIVPTIDRTRDFTKIRAVVKANQDRAIKGEAPIKEKTQRATPDVGAKGLKTASTEKGRTAYTGQKP